MPYIRDDLYCRYINHMDCRCIYFFLNPHYMAEMLRKGLYRCLLNILNLLSNPRYKSCLVQSFAHRPGRALLMHRLHPTISSSSLTYSRSGSSPHIGHTAGRFSRLVFLGSLSYVSVMSDPPAATRLCAPSCAAPCAQRIPAV